MSDLSKLIEDHRAAMAAYEECDDEAWETCKDAINAKINASTRALLDHRPSTLSEAQSKAEFMASDKAFTLWDDIEKDDLFKALTPAPVDYAAIDALIDEHKAAWVALEAACKVTDDAFGTAAEAPAEEAQGRASDATAAAIWQIIEHPYSSIEELKHGMAYVASHHRTTGDGDPDHWLCGFAKHLIAEKGGAL